MSSLGNVSISEDSYSALDSSPREFYSRRKEELKNASLEDIVDSFRNFPDVVDSRRAADNIIKEFRIAFLSPEILNVLYMNHPLLRSRDDNFKKEYISTISVLIVEYFNYLTDRLPLGKRTKNKILEKCLNLGHYLVLGNDGRTPPSEKELAEYVKNPMNFEIRLEDIPPDPEEKEKKSQKSIEQLISEMNGSKKSKKQSLEEMIKDRSFRSYLGSNGIISTINLIEKAPKEKCISISDVNSVMDFFLSNLLKGIGDKSVLELVSSYVKRKRDTYENVLRSRKISYVSSREIFRELYNALGFEGIKQDEEYVTLLCRIKANLSNRMRQYGRGTISLAKEEIEIYNNLSELISRVNDISPDKKKTAKKYEGSETAKEQKKGISAGLRYGTGSNILGTLIQSIADLTLKKPDKKDKIGNIKYMLDLYSIISEIKNIKRRTEINLRVYESNAGEKPKNSHEDAKRNLESIIEVLNESVNDVINCAEYPKKNLIDMKVDVDDFRFIIKDYHKKLEGTDFATHAALMISTSDSVNNLIKGGATDRGLKYKSLLEIKSRIEDMISFYKAKRGWEQRNVGAAVADAQAKKKEEIIFDKEPVLENDEHGKEANFVEFHRPFTREDYFRNNMGLFKEYIYATKTKNEGKYNAEIRRFWNDSSYEANALKSIRERIEKSGRYNNLSEFERESLAHKAKIRFIKNAEKIVFDRYFRSIDPYVRQVIDRCKTKHEAETALDDMMYPPTSFKNVGEYHQKIMSIMPYYISRLEAMKMSYKVSYMSDKRCRKMIDNINFVLDCIRGIDDILNRKKRLVMYTEDDDIIYHENMANYFTAMCMFSKLKKTVNESISEQGLEAVNNAAQTIDYIRQVLVPLYYRKRVREFVQQRNIEMDIQRRRREMWGSQRMAA